MLVVAADFLRPGRHTKVFEANCQHRVILSLTIPLQNGKNPSLFWRTGGPMKPILALIGESGVGKSSLLARLVNQQPDHFAALPSHTSRPHREDDLHDDLMHRFVSRDVMHLWIAAGAIIAPLDYAGNLYGVLYQTATKVLRDHIGVIALTETVLLEYRSLGFEVYAVRVDGVGHRPRSKNRIQLDRERAEININPDINIVNDHTAPGGFMKAYEALEEFALTLV